MLQYKFWGFFELEKKKPVVKFLNSKLPRDNDFILPFGDFSESQSIVSHTLSSTYGRGCQ